jgi:glycosyltransferase involved in cell wall biosynthesis
VLPATPSFDLVVATIGRRDELARLLDSLGAQTLRSFRVLVVDQNADDRVTSTLDGCGLDVLRLTSPPGLSRARNAALAQLEADVVAFPDDDCTYAPDLLERVAGTLAARPELDGLSGRTAAADGRTSASWKPDRVDLTDDNLWNRVNSAALFLRSELVARVGPFDEALGLGAGTPWSSGEEVDYVIRAVRSGARIAYEPGLVVTHEPPPTSASAEKALRLRDGCSVGYLLRKHRYPIGTRLRMTVRPLGGTLLSAVRLDRTQAALHLATLRGRMRGYRGASSSKISA